MSELNRGFLERSTLRTNVVTGAVDTATFVHLVIQVELVATLDHEHVELVALSLELTPQVLLVLSVEFERRFFFDGRQVVSVQFQGHPIHGVEHIQTDVSIMVVASTKNQAIVVGQVSATEVVGQLQWLTDQLLLRFGVGRLYPAQTASNPDELYL